MIYFCHGVPGSKTDADILGGDPVCADLYAGPAIDTFDTQAFDIPAHVIGFSIGAMAALKIAASRPEYVSHLTLVSPAAPLQLGDFLPEMAGGPVFKIAQKSYFALRMLAWAQSRVFRIAPKKLIKALFAKAGPQDQPFADHAVIQQALQNALIENSNGYCDLITEYVADWSTVLSDVTCPVTIYHGTADTWSPPAMAIALQQALPNGATLNWVKNGEHYSTLAATQLP